MKSLYEGWIQPYIESPEFLTLPALILSLLIFHILASKRNKRQLLLDARVKAYKKFGAEYSIGFSSPAFTRMDLEISGHNDKINNLIKLKNGSNLSKENNKPTKKQEKESLELDKKLKELEENNQKYKINFLTQKRAFRVTKLFDECRLVAGGLLERKLRDMYTKISEELNSGEIKSKNTEYYLLGLEIEQYMRYDLGSINYFQLLGWRVFFFWKKLQKHEKPKSESKNS